MDAAQNPYDTIQYPSLAFTHTHPDRLAAMAILHGLSPAPVENCRVLEIGCSDGGNLIPMAYAIPAAEFVGFDLAQAPIERGQARIRELGLKNARMFQADLLEVGAELGQFDFMIANGLYAWVPEPVSDRLLKLCGELLTPDGVAFISYNALPGGYVRNMVREMMLDRVNGDGGVEQQVGGAMGFVRSLLATRPEDDAYRRLIEEHLGRMEERAPEAIYHDELSTAYRPVHFIDFVRHAGKHGLQFLSEAVLPPPPDPGYRYDVRSELEKAAPGDLLKQEQMLDFARARKFRETLLCRADRVVRRDYALERFRRLLLSSPATAAPSEEPGATAFKLSSGIKMDSKHPGVTALLCELERAWPQALSFAELEPRIEEETGYTFDSDGATLLMRLAVAKFIELHGWSAPVATEISARPRASACSRQEILTRTQAATLLHSTVKLEDPVARRFLVLMDGTRDRNEMAAALQAEFPNVDAEEIVQRMEPSLEFFYRAGFLEG
jgi:SAM-dependent methyltransferase